MRNRYHHIFFLYKILHAYFICEVSDFRFTAISKFLFYFIQFIRNNLEPHSFICKNFFKRLIRFIISSCSFLILSRSIPVRRCNLSSSTAFACISLIWKLLIKPFFCNIWCSRISNKCNYFIKVIERNKITFKDMRSFFCFF